MANKRMLSKYVIDSDAFLDMPLSTQALYMHLCMRADDDGFIGNPKRIQKLIGASDDDLKLLIVKRFVLVFENGVIVIKHWRMHNTIQKDRYTPTVYQDEISMLAIKKNKSYTDNLAVISGPVSGGNILETNWKQSGNTGLGLDSGLDSGSGLDTGTGEIKKKTPPAPKEPKHIYGEYKHVRLTDKQRDKLFSDYGESKTMKAIKFLDEYIQEKGVSYKDHNLTLRRWVFRAVDEREQKQFGSQQNGAINWDDV